MEYIVNIMLNISKLLYEKGEIDKIKVTEEAIKDLETNIQIGTIIIRNRLEENNYNIYEIKGGKPE